MYLYTKIATTRYMLELLRLNSSKPAQGVPTIDSDIAIAHKLVAFIPTVLLYDYTPLESYCSLHDIVMAGRQLLPPSQILNSSRLQMASPQKTEKLPRPRSTVRITTRLAKITAHSSNDRPQIGLARSRITTGILVHKYPPSSHLFPSFFLQDFEHAYNNPGSKLQTLDFRHS